MNIHLYLHVLTPWLRRGFAEKTPRLSFLQITVAGCIVIQLGGVLLPTPAQQLARALAPASFSTSDSELVQIIKNI